MINWVYVVYRIGGGKMRAFVYDKLENAELCVNRLKEMYPEEKIWMEKNIVREDYK